MARTVYIKDSLTGGASTALDGVNGDDLIEGDIGLCYVSNIKYEYRLDASNGAAESSPDIIVPDTNPGTKNWILQGVTNSTDAAAENTDIDTGTETVDSFADDLAFGAVWHYVLDNGSRANMRAGTIVACWDTVADSTPKYRESATADIGTTLGVVSFSVDKSTNTVRLRCTTTSDDWSCYVSRKLLGV